MTTPSAQELEFSKPIQMGQITEESKSGSNIGGLEVPEPDEMMHHPIEFKNLTTIGPKVVDLPVKKIKKKPKRPIEDQANDMRLLLNKIFAVRGGFKINDVAADFADGVLYEELFNILFDENVDCCLE